MNTDQWLEALANASTGANADGWTTRDIMAVTGWSDELTRKRVSVAIACGKVAFAGRRTATRIDGVSTQVPAYKLLTP